MKLDFAYFDIDNTLLGELWPLDGVRWCAPNVDEFSWVLALLASHEVKGIPVTGRPPSQVALVAPILGGAYAVAEQGCSAFIAPWNRIVVNEAFGSWKRDVRGSLLALLEPVLARDDVVLQPGDRQVTVCLYPRLPDADITVSELHHECCGLLSDSGLPIEIHLSLGVDITPSDPRLSKQLAFEWIESGLHTRVYEEPVRWNRVAYFEDSLGAWSTCVPWLADRGAIVVGVPTGSNDTFLAAVRDCGGIVAPAPGERGVRMVLQQLLGA